MNTKPVLETLPKLLSKPQAEMNDSFHSVFSMCSQNKANAVL